MYTLIDFLIILVGFVASIITIILFIKKYYFQSMSQNELSSVPQMEQHAGIVSIGKIMSEKQRLPHEVFSAELLTRPIYLKKQENGRNLVRINRNNVNQAVISTEAKKALCNHYVSGREKFLKYKDNDIHRFLSFKTRDNEKEILLDKFPLRWASGGVLSVVNFKKDGEKKLWSPFFFRDIKPFGWNIALGASERYFDDSGILLSDINKELNDPWEFISREFLEETLILNDRPQEEKILKFKNFYFDIAEKQAQKKQASFFAKKHIKLRQDYDKLNIKDSEDDDINIYLKSTNTDIEIINNGIPNRRNDVLVSFNLLELGIEVIKVIQYDLDEKDYLLDGEIWEHGDGVKELVRMPVALISHDYLKKVFGKNKFKPRYTKGIQPSIKGKRIRSKDIHFFNWDIIQRLRVLDRNDSKKEVGKELDRYEKWFNNFKTNFLDKHDNPTDKKPSILFTPASAKILNLFFCQNES